MMRMPPDPPRFAVDTLEELASLLLIPPGTIEYVARNLSRFYYRKPISKNDGTERVLWVPRGTLREIQDQIKCEILSRVQFSRYAHGGVKGKSVKTFANRHAGRDVLLSMDIKSCFPSIGAGKVRNAFAQVGFCGDALALLVKLTTWEFQLPQGPPTSTQIANMVMAQLDRRQAGLAKQHSARYDRFVDDMGISGDHRLRKLKGLHERIVLNEGFALKEETPSKKRLMGRGQDRQQILNLVLNEKPNLPRERRNAIMREISVVLESGAPMTASQIGKLAWLRSINPTAALRLQNAAHNGKGK